MKKTLLALSLILAAASLALAAPADRWLHIRVEQKGEKAEKVRINVPLELAEKVLPAIQTNELRDGKVKMKNAQFNGLDLRVLLDAVRTSKDNEYVSVESANEKVRVAKVEGNLVVRVREGKDEAKQVDLTLPFPVVDALLSGAKDEFDLVAGVRALGSVGDMVLVMVKDVESEVRIWVDSQNLAE